MAYRPRMAAALSGATEAQLAYWRHGDQQLLVPEVSREKPVLYSFRDIVALRTFVRLRGQRPLQTIRKALNQLREIGETEHLSSYILVEQGRKSIALIDASGEGAVDLIERPGQQVTVIKLGDVLRSFPLDGFDVVDLLRPRKRISVDPAVRRGHPVVAGTRISYELVAGLVRDGVAPEEIKDFYPGVTAAAARDAVAFADYVDRAARRQAA